MSLTELELVLLVSVAILVGINYSLSRVLKLHRQAHAIVMYAINDVADKKAAFYRKADGSIGCKPTNSTENPHETSEQT